MPRFLKRIRQIKELYEKKSCNGYILSTFDEYLNEYVPEESQRLKWLTGFRGSNGLVLLIDDKRLFFTDGRYTSQAKKELHCSFTIIDSSEQDIFQWLVRNVKKKRTICLDCQIHSTLFAKKLLKITNNNILIKFNKKILIDDLIKQEKKYSVGSIFFLPLKFSGQNSKNKIRKIKEKIKDIDYYIITNPYSVNWLLNIRGYDLEFSPIVLCRMIITKSQKDYLFINKKKIDEKMILYLESLNIEICGEEDIFDKIKKISSESKVLIDEKATYIFYDLLKKKKVLSNTTSYICSLEKAKKNKVEIKNSIFTHKIDAIAMIKFMYWLDNQSKYSGLDEFYLLEKLDEFRKESDAYFCPSFSTISAIGKSGSIIHYAPSKEKSNTIKEGDLYLCDSGGHYFSGTTDLTRTFLIGKKKTNKDFKSYYTKVLKGHINLSMTRFPKNTKGVQLDSIARYYLWQGGLDYNHGTSHGVGNFLSVHEGPQSISKSLINVPIAEGMVLSNEPGLYLENQFGIRIENLVYVKKSKYKNFLEFATLTMVPYEKKLIDKSQLENDQIEWINEYHRKIYKLLAPYLKTKQNRWLEIKTSPI